MDFELSEDQEALAEGIRKVCEGRFPIEAVRALEASGGVERTSWRELAETGVFALRLPEADGGVGLGTADAVLVFEELGRAIVPGPLLASHLAAGSVDGVAEGDRIVGLVDRRDGIVLVEHLAALDELLIIDDQGVWGVEPASLDATAVARPLDPLTPVHRVVALPQGRPMGDAEVAARWALEGAVFAAAQLLGIAEATQDLAVAYAKQRMQFGKPIGSFQAVKHLLADMLVRSEVARAAVYAAGVTLDDPVVGDPVKAASTAKMMAGEAATGNAKTGVQVFGGMGFTWEVDVHLYLKRAWVLETVFGTSEDHAEVLAALL
jgi:alkylation response protein AidB-like acyl-CoA dehydrogenase